MAQELKVSDWVSSIGMSRTLASMMGLPMKMGMEEFLANEINKDNPDDDEEVTVALARYIKERDAEAADKHKYAYRRRRGEFMMGSARPHGLNFVDKILKDTFSTTPDGDDFSGEEEPITDAEEEEKENEEEEEEEEGDEDDEQAEEPPRKRQKHDDEEESKESEEDEEEAVPDEAEQELDSFPEMGAAEEPQQVPPPRLPEAAPPSSPESSSSPLLSAPTPNPPPRWFRTVSEHELLGNFMSNRPVARTQKKQQPNKMRDLF